MDANTLYYSFSTMAQVLAAILAVSVVFVFAKSSEYIAKMQREMGNVVGVYDIVANNVSLTEWRLRATKAERHGVLIEMKDIFAGTVENLTNSLIHAQSPLSPATVGLINQAKEFCANGQANFEYNELLFKRYASLIVFGLVLILLDLFGLALTPWLHHRCPAQYLALWSVLLLTSVFFLLLARFIFSTTKEKSRYTENK